VGGAGVEGEGEREGEREEKSLTASSSREMRPLTQRCISLS